MAGYTQQLKNICKKQAANSNAGAEVITRFGTAPSQESDLWLIKILNRGTPQTQF